MSKRTTKPKPGSNCCGANVAVMSSGGETYIECTKCRQQCRMVRNSDKPERQQPTSWNHEDLLEAVGRIAGRLRYGCGNSGCCIKPPDGMATNGPCRCSPQRFALQLLDLAVMCERVGPRW